jgi:hypothetical protein
MTSGVSHFVYALQDLEKPPLCGNALGENDSVVNHPSLVTCRACQDKVNVLWQKLVEPGHSDPFKIEITKTTSKTDPPIDLLELSLQNDDGEWRETFGSASEKELFLRGVRACAGMLGRHILADPVVIDHEVE